MCTLIEAKDKFLSQYVMASTKTQCKYKDDIDLFLKICEIDSLNKLNDFSETDMAKFYAYAKSKEWSSNTTNQRIQSVKLFTKFCTKKHLISDDYLSDIKMIRTQNEVHYTPSKDEFDKFLTYIKEHTDKKRLYLMVKLISVCGFRKSEICSLKVKDINKENSTIRVIGKGNKIVEQPVPASTLLELLEYIETERQETIEKYIALGGKDLGYIFLSGIGNNVNKEKKDLRNGNQVDNNAFYQQIKRYAKLSGLENADKFTTHCLRRNFATTLFEETGDLVLTQNALRHSNISTTSKCYIKFNKNKLVDAVNKLTNEQDNNIGGLNENEEKQLYLLLKKKFGNCV